MHSGNSGLLVPGSAPCLPSVPPLLQHQLPGSRPILPKAQGGPSIQARSIEITVLIWGWTGLLSRPLGDALELGETMGTRSSFC